MEELRGGVIRGGSNYCYFEGLLLKLRDETGTRGECLSSETSSPFSSLFSFPLFSFSFSFLFFVVLFSFLVLNSNVNNLVGREN